MYKRKLKKKYHTAIITHNTLIYKHIQIKQNKHVAPESVYKSKIKPNIQSPYFYTPTSEKIFFLENFSIFKNQKVSTFLPT